ncbi:hypothetical protein JEQ12_006568 [Ovis aries]|uniref:G-protein coupled receptors family 1 profile domain-containing protein n=1 Tax=Ovis aries TaxID=9940 RepID=A0A836A2B4_SHEEP|nr:hypothetical protein JEQ12_006568 [Ovis aries]
MWFAGGNQSAGAIFTLFFSEYPDLQVPLFLVFLTVYAVTMVGNLGMVTIIRISPKLHTPMYFFPSHLSLVDFCYSTTVTPKLLENLVVEDRTLSFTGCIMRLFLACMFAVAEAFMLAVMAYDQFVAICKPLLCTAVMSPKLYASLVACPYMWGVVSSLTLTCPLQTLSFCGSNIMNNFPCEHSAIVSVSRSDPFISQVISFAISTFNEVSSLAIIFTTCISTFGTIIKMPSAGGRQKAFSTCASHLTAIIMFHGTILFLYSVPRPKNSWLRVKVGSVFYIVVSPMLNPLIYSLRNKDVKESVRKLMNHLIQFGRRSVCPKEI